MSQNLKASCHTDILELDKNLIHVCWYQNITAQMSLTVEKQRIFGLFSALFLMKDPET